MDEERFRRFRLTVYTGIAFLAVIFLLIGTYVVQEGSFSELLINLAAELLSVAVIFFLVYQFFQHRPEEVLLDKLEFSLSDLNNLLEQEKEKVKITRYSSEPAIYDAAKTLLINERWETVCIFAPVGLWKPSSHKKEWLDKLANHAKEKSVERVFGVFGLPPKKEDKKTYRPKKEVAEDLKYVKDSLSNFNGRKNVMLRYYPPTYAAVGFGALIFKRKDGTGQVAFALASHNVAEVVDVGFSVNHIDVLAYASNWFTHRIFYSAVNAFILQEERSLEDSWEEIITTWYGPEYLQLLNDLNSSTDNSQTSNTS